MVVKNTATLYKVAILTHFGMSVWRAKPWQIAERLSADRGQGAGCP
ncbi:hypothetical protein ACFLWL_02000 [Chloroflexota bacterium]